MIRGRWYLWSNWGKFFFEDLALMIKPWILTTQPKFLQKRFKLRQVQSKLLETVYVSRHI